MSQKPVIEVLESNHSLRSPDEVTIFAQALAERAQKSKAMDLLSLPLILDDACE
ncbi:MAG: hypothetical protein HC781_04645 [Leptolyngbyaceae cyanobacterium CSU_1_4]|nr:hypothetical protein [Leptolyngbyaceae cyanobacterium CSU_1_4]